MRHLLAHTLLSAGMLPLLFAACSTTTAGASERSIAAGSGFAMASGERVTLPDSGTLRYVKVTNDSRCPPGKQCVWAGDAEVEFEWTASSGKPESFTLHTGRGDRSKDMGGHRLTLESLERGAAPTAQLRLDAAP